MMIRTSSTSSTQNAVWGSESSNKGSMSNNMFLSPKAGGNSNKPSMNYIRGLLVSPGSAAPPLGRGSGNNNNSNNNDSSSVSVSGMLKRCASTDGFALKKSKQSNSFLQLNNALNLRNGMGINRNNNNHSASISNMNNASFSPTHNASTSNMNNASFASLNQSRATFNESFNVSHANNESFNVSFSSLSKSSGSLTNLAAKAKAFRRTMQQQQLPRKKRVTFSRMSLTSTVFIISRQEYTPQEKEDAFYTSADYHEFSDGVVKEAEKLSSGKKLKDKKYCARGLESRTGKARAQHELVRRTCVSAVLREQQYQREEMVVNLDWYKIGKVSREISANSILAAQCRGRLDEEYARKKVYNKTETAIDDQ